MASDVPFRLHWLSALVPAHAKGPILEVGCGNGQLLSLLASHCARAEVVGIDRSAVQARRAIARLAELPAASRPVVHTLALEDAPRTLPAHGYALIVAMNVNAFWTDAERAFAAARALLAPRGRVLLGYESPSASAQATVHARILQSARDASFAPHQEHRAPDSALRLFALMLK